MTTQLQELKRNELQSICKAYQLKANGTKEVLIQLILDHERSEKERYDASNPSPVAKKTTTSKKSKAVVTPKARQIRIEEEDELMMGGEDVQSTTTSKKGKSVVATQSSKKSVKEAGLALAGAIGESTNPNKSFDDLVSLVNKLQSELETTKAAFVEVSNKLRSVSLPAPPIDIAAVQREILSRVESQLEAYRKEQREMAERQGVEMRRLIEESELATDERRIARELELGEQARDDKRRDDAALASMWKETTARLDALETQQIAQASLLSSSQRAVPAIQPLQARQSITAPLDSPSAFDAPPTRSLTSLSFTPSSPLPEDQLPAPSSVTGLTSPVVGSSPRLASPRRTSPRKSVGAVQRIAPWVGEVSEGSSGLRVGAGAAGTPQGLASGKRARENDDEDSGIVRRSESAGRGNAGADKGEVNGGAMTPEESRERKRTKVNEQEAESSEEEDSFDASIIVGNKEVRSRDLVIQTKTGEELIASMSTSNPSFFASTAPNSRSASPQKSNVSTTGSVSRNSLPITSLPFPIVSPFRKSTKSSPPTSILARATAATTIFGDSSNSLPQSAAPKSTFSFSQPTSIHPPRSIARLPAPSTIVTSTAPPQATPLAFKTLFGTEKSATRFGDEVVDSPLGGTTPVGYGALGGGVRRNTPSKPRFGGWGGFGQN